MILLIHPAALAELQDATVFYGTHASALLGRAFVDEFERATRLLLANPHLGAAQWPASICNSAFPLQRGLPTHRGAIAHYRSGASAASSPVLEKANLKGVKLGM